jgi:hypothetical protein
MVIRHIFVGIDLGDKIRMPYEVSACGLVLRDEAEAMKMSCWVLAVTPQNSDWLGNR